MAETRQLRGVRIEGRWLGDREVVPEPDEWAIVHPQLWRVLEHEGHDVAEVLRQRFDFATNDVCARPPRRMVRRWLSELLRLRHPTPPLLYGSARWYKRTQRHRAALGSAWRLGGVQALLEAHDVLVGRGGWSKLP